MVIYDWHGPVLPEVTYGFKRRWCLGSACTRRSWLLKIHAWFSLKTLTCSIYLQVFNCWPKHNTCQNLSVILGQVKPFKIQSIGVFHLQGNYAFSISRHTLSICWLILLYWNKGKFMKAYTVKHWHIQGGKCFSTKHSAVGTSLEKTS